LPKCPHHTEIGVTKSNGSVRMLTRSSEIAVTAHMNIIEPLWKYLYAHRYNLVI